MAPYWPDHRKWPWPPNSEDHAAFAAHGIRLARYLVTQHEYSVNHCRGYSSAALHYLAWTDTALASQYLQEQVVAGGEGAVPLAYTDDPDAARAFLTRIEIEISRTDFTPSKRFWTLLWSLCNLAETVRAADPELWAVAAPEWSAQLGSLRRTLPEGHPALEQLERGERCLQHGSSYWRHPYQCCCR